MFKIAKLQLYKLVTSYKFYLGAIMCSIALTLDCMNLIEFSERIGEFLCIYDVVIYTFANPFNMTVVFLCSLINYVDIPFSSSSDIYILIRGDRSVWIKAIFTYILISTLLFFSLVMLLLLLFMLPNAYLSNVWSVPLYKLALVDEYMGVDFGVGFGFSDLLYNFSPFTTMLLSMSMSSLYSITMAMFLFLFNITKLRKISFCLIGIIHFVGYMIEIFSFTKYFEKYSLLSRSIFAYNSFSIDEILTQRNTIYDSILVFLIINIILIILIYKKIKHFNFDNQLN